MDPSVMVRKYFDERVHDGEQLDHHEKVYYKAECVCGLEHILESRQFLGRIFHVIVNLVNPSVVNDDKDALKTVEHCK